MAVVPHRKPPSSTLALVWQAYMQQLRVKPLRTKALTAAAIFAVSDSIAQGLNQSPYSLKRGLAVAVCCRRAVPDLPRLFAAAHVTWARVFSAGACCGAAPQRTTGRIWCSAWPGTAETCRLCCSRCELTLTRLRAHQLATIC